MSLEFISYNSVSYMQWKELSKLGIKHCFTTYPEDMGVRTNSDKSNLVQNYNKAKTFANLKSKQTFFAQQIHDKNIGIIKSLSDGTEFFLGRYMNNTDAIITDIPDVTLITQYADCTPITLWDTKNRVLASVHSGWRGTSLKIIESSISGMISNYNSNPADIHCFVWPSIGCDDFEVDEDVADIFRDSFSFADEVIYKKSIKYHIDLVSIIQRVALENNLLKEHIYLSNISTFSDMRFHSYRRDKENSGRMALLMEI